MYRLSEYFGFIPEFTIYKTFYHICTYVSVLQLPWLIFYINIYIYWLECLHKNHHFCIFKWMNEIYFVYSPYHLRDAPGQKLEHATTLHIISKTSGSCTKPTLLNVGAIATDSILSREVEIIIRDAPALPNRISRHAEMRSRVRACLNN